MEGPLDSSYLCPSQNNQPDRALVGQLLSSLCAPELSLSDLLSRWGVPQEALPSSREFSSNPELILFPLIHRKRSLATTSGLLPTVQPDHTFSLPCSDCLRFPVQQDMFSWRYQATSLCFLSFSVLKLLSILASRKKASQSVFLPQNSVV